MNTAIQELMRFQMDRELHKQPYNVLNEHTNIIEELLESVGFNIPKEKREELSIAWTDFIEDLIKDYVVVEPDEPSTHDQVDAYADVIVFAVGALTKLGYDPEKVLLEVGKEINSRKGEMVNGKFEKFTDKQSTINWHKANFDWCSLEGAEKLQRRRKAFFSAEGYMGSEEEVEKWVANLI